MSSDQISVLTVQLKGAQVRPWDKQDIQLGTLFHSRSRDNRHLARTQVDRVSGDADMMERELWCSGDETFVNGAVLPERLEGALVCGAEKIGGTGCVNYLVGEGEDAKSDKGHLGGAAESENQDMEEF